MQFIYSEIACTRLKNWKNWKLENEKVLKEIPITTKEDCWII